MKVIYRKADLQCVGTVFDNMTTEQEIELNVIPNFGGVTEDYDYIETDEQHFHLELIADVLTVVKDEPVILPQPPTAEERLSAIEDLLITLI